MQHIKQRAALIVLAAVGVAWQLVVDSSSLGVGRRKTTSGIGDQGTELGYASVANDVVLSSRVTGPMIKQLNLSQMFADHNMTVHYARGMNVLTPLSGCQFAAKVFQGVNRKFQDCFYVDPVDRIVNSSLTGIQANETLYLDIRRLGEFVDTALGNLEVPIVLLSGMYQLRKIRSISTHIQQKILNHPNILHWFVHNPTFYTNYNDTLPPKLSAMPYGIQPGPYNPRKSKIKPAEVFRQALAAFRTTNKTMDVFYGYLSPYTNPNRKTIPSGPKLPLTEYYRSLMHSRFVVAPDGDRPECYRHYEALGSGTIPVTNLPRNAYHHFEPGPVLFETADWNLTSNILLERLGWTNETSFPRVNRNMAFEEYWMHYIENEVGRQLTWWDKVGKYLAKLEDFHLDFAGIDSLLSRLTDEFHELAQREGSERQ